MEAPTVAQLCRTTARSALGWTLGAAALSLALQALVGCQGDLYQPCTSKEDCDVVQADGCVLPSTGAQGWCSVLCQVDEDCPEGPKGEPAKCEQVGKAKVCKLK